MGDVGLFMVSTFAIKQNYGEKRFPINLFCQWTVTCTPFRGTNCTEEKHRCSILNKNRRRIRENRLKSAFQEGGIRLAKPTIVKKSISFRVITMTIGILVAMVIALTLWIGTPGHISHARPSQESTVQVAKTYLEHFAGVFTPLHAQLP